MKQESEMTQAEMDDIIAINKRQMPVMMIGETCFGNEVVEGINDYWKELGDKYGFKWDTVEGSAKGKLFFLAEPKPIIIPKTSEEIEQDKYLDGVDWNYLSYGKTRQAINKIIEQLESCNYECEGGYLKNNIAFLALKRMAK
jgi:hypothetical protein